MLSRPVCYCEYGIREGRPVFISGFGGFHPADDHPGDLYRGGQHRFFDVHVEFFGGLAR